MAIKKLGLTVDVDLLLEPSSVKVRETRIQKQAAAALNRALSGAQFAGRTVKFSPDIELDPKAFTKLKAQIDKQAASVLQALDIVKSAGFRKGTSLDKNIAAEIKERRKGGEAVSRPASKLARGVSEQELIFLNEVSRATSNLTARQHEYRAAVQSTQKAYEKSLVNQKALTKTEVEQLENRAGALRRLRDAQTATGALTKTKDIYTSQGKLVRQEGITLAKLQAQTTGAAEEMRHLSSVINHLRREKQAQAEATKKATKATREETAARKAAAKAKRQEREVTAVATARSRRIFTTDPGTAAFSADIGRDIRGQTGYWRGQRDELTKLRGASSDLYDPRRLYKANRQLEALAAKEKQLHAIRAKAAKETREATAQQRREEAALEKQRQAARRAAAQRGAIYKTDPQTPAQAADQLRQVGAYRSYLQKQRDSLTGVSGYGPKRLEKVNRQIAQLAAREADIRRLNKAFTDTGKALTPMNEKLGQSSLLIRQFFRYALGYGILYKMIGAIGALTTGVLELDKALFSIKAITAATDEQMTHIAGSIKEVAVATKFTTSEVAKAAQVLAQAGVEPEQINSVLSSVATFAAGTETSIATAADLVSTMRNVFKELDDLTIANQLTKAINISKLTGDDLKTILSISAQIARRFNITSEQYLAAVSTLRNAGVKASTVATGLRQGLLEIFSPDSKSMKDLKRRYAEIGEQLSGAELRTKFFRFTQEANPLLAVLRELNRLGFTGSGRKTLARSLDVRAANAITALIKNIDELEESETRLVSGNAALDASATQMDSLSNSIDNLGAAMTVLASDISEGPVRALEDIVDAATGAIQALDLLHATAKEKGGEGLLPAIQLGAATGLVGAMLGRTPVQKALAGTAGLAGGAYAGVKLTEADDQGLVKNAADAALLAALLIPLFGGMSKAVGGSLTFLKGKPLDIGPTVTTTVGFMGLISGWFGSLKGIFSKAGLQKLPGLIAKLAPRALGFVGVIWTAYEILDGLFGIFEDADELEEARNKVEGLKRKSVRQGQKVSRIEKELKQYRPSEGAYQAESGTLARRLEDMKKAVASYNFAFNSIFGDLGDEKKELLQEQLRKLREIGFEETAPARTEILEEIRSISGVGIGKLSETQKVFFRSTIENAYSGLRNAFKGQAKEIKQKLSDLSEKEAKESLTEVEKGWLESYKIVAGTIPEFVTALQNEAATVPLTKFVDALVEMNSRVYELGVEATGITEQQEAEAGVLRDRIRGEFLTMLKDSSTTSGQLQNTVSGLIGAALGLPEHASDLMGAIQQEIETHDAALKVALAEREKSLKVAQAHLGRQQVTRGGYLEAIFGGKGGAEYAQDVEAAQTAVTATRGQLGGIATVRQQLGAGEAARASIIAKENENLAARVSAAVLTIAEPGFVDAVSAELQKNEGLSALVNRVLEAVAESPPQLDKIVQELLSKGKTHGGRVFLPETLGRSAGADLLRLVAGRQAAGTASPRTGERPETRRHVKDPATFRAVAALETDITQAQKTHLERLILSNEALNPILARRNLLLTEVEREIAVTRKNIENIEEFYKEFPEGSDEHGKKLKELNAQELKLAEQQIKRDKYRSDAAAKIDDARLKLQQKWLDHEKQLLQAEQKDLGVSIATASERDDVKALAGLQKQRLQLRLDLLANERDKLQLEDKDNDLIERIIKAKEREVRAAEAVSAAQEQIALAQERLKYDRGDFTTRSPLADAYRQSSGAVTTRNQEASNLASQITNIRAEIKAQEHLKMAAPLEAVEEYNTELERMEGLLGKMLGTYETLTVQATNAFQVDRLTDLDRWSEKFQALNSDLTNFADNIQNRVVGAIDSIGEALADAAIEGDNLWESLQTVIHSAARDIAATSAKTFINMGVQGILGGVWDVGALMSPEGENKQALTDNTAALRELTRVQAVSVGLPGGGGISGGQDQAGGIWDSMAGWFSGLSTDIQGAGEETVTATQSAASQQQASTTDQSKQQQGWFTQLVGVMQLVYAVLASSQVKEVASGALQLIGTAASAWSSSGAATGAVAVKVPGYADGTPGVIRGPGTGTSDSIAAMMVDSQGRSVSPIRVSDGESILTAKATKVLGADFIARLNSSKSPMGFASGAVFSKMQGMGASTSPVTVMSEGVAQAIPATEVNAATRIVNVVDPALVTDTMSSSSGERVILNTIQRAGYQPSRN